MTDRDSRDKTMLIVEDAEDARFFMRLAMEQLGYKVFEAEDGEKAVAVAQRERPDIILMDLSLPIMDGFAATKIIRTTDGMNGVTIIVVTAHQGTDFREEARGAGFDAYVTKPIDIDSLNQLIVGLSST